MDSRLLIMQHYLYALGYGSIPVQSSLRNPLTSDNGKKMPTLILHGLIFSSFSFPCRFCDIRGWNWCQYKEHLTSESCTISCVCLCTMFDTSLVFFAHAQRRIRGGARLLSCERRRFSQVGWRGGIHRSYTLPWATQRYTHFNKTQRGRSA